MQDHKQNLSIVSGPKVGVSCRFVVAESESKIFLSDKVFEKTDDKHEE